MTDALLTRLAATDERFVLSEGPQWNPAEQTVSWVDIEGKTLSIADLAPDGELDLREQRQFDDRVSFAHPLPDGAYLIGLGPRLAVSRPAGVDEVSEPLVPEGRRLNDSVIDPSGRLLVGSMTLDGPHDNNLLMRLEHDGSVTVLDRDLRLSNGLGFSPDDVWLYSVDSLRGVVYRRPYTSHTGPVGPRGIFVTFDGVEPDGLTVDADGSVWVALWGGGCVQQFAVDGTLMATIDVGAPHVTSVEFAGLDMQNVVITTSMLLLDEAERANTPEAGRVHTFAGDVRGLARYRWNALPLSRVTGID